MCTRPSRQLLWQQVTLSFSAVPFIERPRHEAALLLAFVLGVEPLALLSAGEVEIQPAEEALINAYAARRLAGEPLSRIKGVKEFWGLNFHISSAVLDPRPDSETLIEAVLAAFPDKTQPLSMVDFGTGSGCLLLSLLHEYQQATGVGVDYSPAALRMAAFNAVELGFEKRANFLASDWSAALNGEFDVIISNPPYINSQDIAGLDVSVKNYDPLLALDGGGDGLAAYRLLLADCKRLLQPHGRVFFEIGYSQRQDLYPLITMAGFEVAKCWQDLGGRDRIIEFYLPN
ncbi:MAG: peptide chain release factor N(5)-glutamine methyltransferase [Alphaproteobacteria bacterium]